ncbi:hypothetical protein C1N80_12385 [Brachybacterium sp. SGAir0954]|uniref:DUF6314 family protein n=1 Tax=Brachybacterium sp. SGAir0954 TaxID=2571029 RepID=UPI0010CD3A6A|nr:DUF6314 family protein [Brachybacterium sp. SGAir0954]QCR54292.1 hypothetical protein C1N80_12385 [Brachybacterium sp. SGAir0954]
MHGSDRTPEPTQLLGAWDLTRRIEDRAAGERMSVRGTALLELCGPGEVRWSESGELRRGDGRRSPVSRTLRILRGDDGWTVHLPDGSPFHRWQARSPLVHLCGEDVYRGRLELPGEDRWTLTWQVTGPRKDLLLMSELERPAGLYTAIPTHRPGDDGTARGLPPSARP